MRAVEAEILDGEPRRRVAAARAPPPAPAAPGRRAAPAAAPASRAARSAAPPARRRRRAPRSRPWPAGGAAPGSRRRRHRPPAASRRRRGRAPASASSKPGARSWRKARSTSSSCRSGISPRKTSVRCRLSGGTGARHRQALLHEHQVEAHRLGQRDGGEGADHGRARARDQLQHRRADALDDGRDALGVRVEAVGLEQPHHLRACSGPRPCRRGTSARRWRRARRRARGTSALNARR